MTTLVEQYVGATAYDVSGAKIGKIDKLFVDGRTRQPKWASVRTGFLGTSHAILPLTGSRRDGRVVTVTVEKDVVKQAPGVQSGEGITNDDAHRLTKHYHLNEGEQPEAPDPAQQTSHSAVLGIASAAAGIGGTAVNTAAWTADIAEDERPHPEDKDSRDPGA